MCLLTLSSPYAAMLTTIARRFPGEATRLHAPFDDPPRLAEGEEDDEAALNHYRRVRDEIQEFCQTIPEKLQGSGS